MVHTLIDKKYESVFVLLIYFCSFVVVASEVEFGDQEWINLYHDQPIYFIVGTPESKVQLSVKAKPFKTTKLYIAYTQKIFWDLFKQSSPFRDVNYNPSLFYRTDWLHDSESIVDLIVYEHESNGKGGDGSRSWDRTGIRYQTIYKFKNSIKLTLSGRTWISYRHDIQNGDLDQYRGVYEMIFTLSNFTNNILDMDDLSFRFYPGGGTYLNPFMGGRELTFRFKDHKTIFLSNIVFQIFQGYAENLLEYKNSIWSFRVGVGI